MIKCKAGSAKERCAWETKAKNNSTPQQWHNCFFHSLCQWEASGMCDARAEIHMLRQKNKEGYFSIFRKIVLGQERINSITQCRIFLLSFNLFLILDICLLWKRAGLQLKLCSPFPVYRGTHAIWICTMVGVMVLNYASHAIKRKSAILTSS